VKPYLEASIYARANGYLTKLLVDIGQQVKEGQLLAEIDTPELNQELARAKAELAQAEAAFGLSQKTAARWSELLKSSSVSEQEAAEKSADLALKSATRDAAQAGVRRLEDLQSFQHVTAPFAGTVVARFTDVGALIAQNSGRELFRLAQTSTLRVYVRVPQTAAAEIKAGQLVEIRVPELPGEPLNAKVARTSGMVSSESRTVLTELALENKDFKVLAGSYVQARFKETLAPTALTLPSSTLLFRAEGPQVGIVDTQNRVTLHDITIGRDFGASFEVLKGISPGDKIIANPPDALVSGMTVRIASAAEPTAKP
jgi:RND family efflux transporter MFP subunit